MSERVDFYVNFPGTAAKAAKFYEKIFGKQVPMMQFKDFPSSMEMQGIDLELVGHAELGFDNANMMFADDPLNKTAAGSQITLSWWTSDQARFQQVWDAFIAGGAKVENEPEKTFWAERYGRLVDPFGVPWMIQYNPEPAAKPDEAR